MAKHKPPLTVSDLRSALLHDTRKMHAKEIKKISEAKVGALCNLALEFGSTATIKLFDRYDAQEEK